MIFVNFLLTDRIRAATLSYQKNGCPFSYQNEAFTNKTTVFANYNMSEPNTLILLWK